MVIVRLDEAFGRAGDAGMTLEELIYDWERWMRRREKSEKTIVTYRQYLTRFAREVRVPDISRLKGRHLEDFQDRLREEGLSTGTRMMAVTGLRSMLAYARKQRLNMDPYLVEALETIHVRHRERREVLQEDFEKVVRYLTPMPKRPRLSQLRDRALFFYLIYTAARVSEALQVRRDDYIRPVVQQKGGGPQVLYTSEDSIRFVEEYLAARTDDSEWLWPSFTPGKAVDRPLSDGGVRQIWSRLCGRLGIPYFTTHQLRHSHATYAKRAGADRDATQAQLGHSDPKMMERYRHFDDEQREEEVSRLQSYVRQIAQTGPPERPRLLERLKKRLGGR